MVNIIQKRGTSFLSVTDQFCGAGGSSQGARRLGMEVQLAMNHTALCIETHNTNFPDTAHACTDISAAEPRDYWGTDILITSPECTNHSIAKGARRQKKQRRLLEIVDADVRELLFPARGQKKQRRLLEDDKPDPDAERSRATMWDVVRFAEVHQYRLIVVENVVDARAWILFDDWLRTMHTLGYNSHIVYLNSMFAHLRPLDNPQHGDFAPQSRDRMYVVFWRRGNRAPDLEIRPLAWCPVCERDVEAVQVWKNTDAVRRHGGRWGQYGKQYYYACPGCSRPRKMVRVHPYFYAAANAIDWSLQATRIGDRKRPLKAQTMARIRKGLEMFAGQHLVIDTSRTYGDDRRSVPILSTLLTQTTAQAAGLLVLPFVVETLFAGTRKPRGADEAMATQTARQSHGLVLPPFLTVNYTPGYSRGIDGALATVTSQDHHGLVVPPFLLGYANGESPPRGADEPLRTFHTQNGQGIVIPPLLTSVNYYDGIVRPVDGVLPTQTTGEKLALTVPPFLLSYYGSNGGLRGVDGEMGTVTTVDRHALVNPDALIEDCSFRMLQPHEIGRGMAFDNDYVVLGNNRDKVWQYGNAVTPPAMELLLRRCLESLE